MFDRGGNAIDAAVASGFALNVLEPQSCGIGGEVPILIYSARDGKPFALSGQGWVGKAATVEWFRKAKIDRIPGDGFLPATVPAAFGSWALALLRFGTLTLKDVLEPVIDYAASGFAVYPGLRNSLAGLARRFKDEWPDPIPAGRPAGDLGRGVAMILDQINYENLLIPLNKFYDLHVGGPRRHLAGRRRSRVARQL